MINDQCNSLRYGNSILFADDATIYIIGRNLWFLKQTMQADLVNLSKWMHTNNLVLNVKKTKCMVIRPKGSVVDTSHIDLQINSENIKQVEYFKFLGVWLDSKLIWEKQVDMLCHKLTQQKYFIQQVSAMLLLDSLKLLYYSYIHSNILYRVLVWGSMISKKSIYQLSFK